MAMLKTIVAHAGKRGQSARRIEDYLRHGSDHDGTANSAEEYLDHGHGRRERVAAFAASSNLEDVLGGGQTGWADAMDCTRRIWDKDKGRLWYHQIISPDPADHVGPEECRALAAEWAEKAHPGHQWVAVVHTDSDSGVIHAHVITNSVHPTTGRKLHMSEQDVVREARILSQLCEEHGLTPMEDIVAYRERTRGSRVLDRRDRCDMATRAIVRDGRRSWVEETKDAIVRATEGSLGWGDFVRRMEEQGWRLVPNRDGDVTYYHPESRGFDKRVRARSLGADWRREAIVDRMGINWDAMLDSSWDEWAAGFESPLAYRLVAERAVVRRHTDPERKSGRASLMARLESPYSRRYTSRAEAMLRAIATIDREGVGSLAALNARGNEVGLELDRASALASEMMRGSRQVEEALAAIDRRDELEKAMRALPEGTWDPETRRRRNAMRKELEKAEADVRVVLEPCSQWIGRAGHGGSDDRDKLVAVATRLMERALDANERAGDLAERLSALREAQSVGERILSRRQASRNGIAGARPVPHGRAMAVGTSMASTARRNVTMMAQEGRDAGGGHITATEAKAPAPRPAQSQTRPQKAARRQEDR